jgi:hypothetical protein
MDVTDGFLKALDTASNLGVVIIDYGDSIMAGINIDKEYSLFKADNRDIYANIKYLVSYVNNILISV